MSDEQVILKPAPERLSGRGVVVRPFADEDADGLYEAVRESVEHVRPWLPWYDRHNSVSDTIAYIRRVRAEHTLREAFHMGIFSLEGCCLGGCGMRVHDWKVPSFEIGYWIRQSEEGRGHVTEAARLLTEYAFETLGAERVQIRCNVRNERSARVAERLGYSLEGILRHVERDTSGNLADMRWYSMIPDEYAKARASWPSTPPPSPAP